jgi:hypothetical protein
MTTPAWLRDASMHRVHKLTCIAQEKTSECVGESVIVVLIVFIVSGK